MLDIRQLSTHFFAEEETVKAVDGVSLKVAPGEFLGIVGESGCGKSTLALSILRLIVPPGKIVAGEIFWQGQDLLKLSQQELRKIRGGSVGMIFQDPFSSLNPVYSVGEQIAEAIRLHQGVDRKEAWERTIAALDLVHIPQASQRAKEYPHQFSGGMRQRVMLAMALAGNPQLLLADEPTTALDVTIQKGILDLMLETQKKFKMAVILVTHDLRVVANTCSRTAVMYAGKIVEDGPTAELFRHPQHPYTQSLLASIPQKQKGRN